MYGGGGGGEGGGAARPQTAAVVRSPAPASAGKIDVASQVLSPAEQFEAQKKLAQERGRQRAFEREAKRKAELEIAAEKKKQDEVWGGYDS